MCIIIGKFKVKYLLAFAVAVIYGYVLNFFLWLTRGIVPVQVWHRWLLLILGDVITGIGVAAFFRTTRPLQVYELFVSQIAARFGFGVGRVKWAFDLSLLFLSVILAAVLFGASGLPEGEQIFSASYHSIGLGTVVTTIINSPIITLSGKLLDGIFIPKNSGSSIAGAD
jgi:uncharacterized membrane protein YczE